MLHEISTGDVKYHYFLVLWICRSEIRNNLFFNEEKPPYCLRAKICTKHQYGTYFCFNQENRYVNLNIVMSLTILFYDRNEITQIEWILFYTKCCKSN